MPFGQPTGPPASYRQIKSLTTLVEAAGYADLRDARGALGLTQRQAGGRFTSDEADALIARLESEADATEREAAVPDPAGLPGTAPRQPTRAAPPADRREAELRNRLHTLPAEVLAAELQRRGWVVMEP